MTLNQPVEHSINELKTINAEGIVGNLVYDVDNKSDQNKMKCLFFVPQLY